MDESLQSETLDFEIQTDILTLLENVKCQGNNPSGLKQALLALANICSANSASQDYFYQTEGVGELQTLLLEGCCPLSAVPAALYCLACAVRQNVTSQKAVLTERMFNLIHELLSNSNSSERLLQSAAFLLACSVAGGNKGQLLADETGCLQDLVNLLRDFMASGSEDENTWSSIIRAIGVCVNNPQNAHNQQICCSVLPHILKLVSTESRHKCVGHVLTLISSVVANNVPNQNRIRRCGGIEMLINFIRHQVRVEITAQSLNLLVNAVSAVDACIADNEECGVQAGTLGLVQILLDLLQIKDLELSQMQVFIVTVAHVLESNNEFCRLVNGGRGYYTLVNYLTDCQDEELFKVIKYILTLCKMQGTRESSDVKQHNVHDEDYNGGHESSKRDLTAFLKEGLSALSNQLSSIEKVSEGIQWMTNVNMTAQPVDSFMPHTVTPLRHCYTDQMPPHYTRGEKTGSLNIVKWARQASLPSENSLNDDRQCQGLETTQNASFTGDLRKSSDNDTRQVCQNSSPGNIVHKQCNRIIRPHDAGVEMIKMSRVDSNCKHVQDVGTDNQLKSHHGSLTQAQKRYDLAFSNAHKSVAYTGKSGDSEHLNCYQGLSKHANPMTGSDISQIHGQKHWNTKHDNDFQMHKEGRPNYLSEEINSTCLEEQISYQKHRYQDVDSGNSDISPFSVKETRRQHLTGDKQFPYKRRNTLCPQVQDSGDGKHVVTDCSPNHMEMEQQNCETGDTMQSPVFDQQPCEHHRKMNAVAHKHSESDYVQKAPNSMCCKRSCDRPTTVKSGDGMRSPVFDQQPCKHHKEINAAAHKHSESDYVQKAQNSICCERSCARPADPCLSASSPRNTINDSSSKRSSSHIHVPHLPALQLIPESESYTEQNLEANKFGNRQQDDNFGTCMSPHENQLHLLSQLQKVMSNFFKSLRPGQADNQPRQWKPTNHISPAAQPSGEQDQNSSEIIGSPSSLCKSILSLCEGGNLLDKDQQQKMSQTCLSTTKQTLTDQASKLENNNITLHTENGSLPEIQKYDGIQAVSTSSNCNNGCSLRDNTVHYDDDGGGRSVKTSASNKAIDEDKIFIKPSQPCLPAARTAGNHKAVSNTRFAGTPSTPITFHTSKKAPLPAGHQPPVSPALSVFDSQLRSMAYSGTTGVVTVWRNSVSQNSDDSTSGFESTCTAEAIRNVAPARPSSESKADGQTCKRSALNELQSAGLPTPQLPISTTHKNVPLHRDNMKSQSTHRSFCNQFSHSQSQYITNTVGNKRKSATCFKKRMHNKKKADLEGGGPQYSKSSSCPGCGIGLNLNSCTYNIAIEASPYTCTYHRHIRQCERTYITQQLMSKRTLSASKKGCKDNMGTATSATHDVYDFQSGSEEFREIPSVRWSATSRQNTGKMGRRPRVAYTEQEVLNLLEGVHRMGKHWQQILWTYQFHSSRTAVDLKDKYKQLQAKQAGQTTKQLPFSLCEIRRLKNGVKQLGYNWQAILRSYKFLPGRTAADLHTEWRSLNRVESFSDGVDS